MRDRITYGWVVVSLAVLAGALTIGLTGVAFWLSYEHLHDVAGAHGLVHTSARSWAWPATLDTFIVIGEVLVLRASLLGRTDKFAIFLAAIGSFGSITLNVVGVGQDAGLLDYVVAGVPPVAALLAFAALMRQIHGAVKRYLADAPPRPTETAQAPVSDGPSVPPVPASQPGVPVAQAPVQPIRLTKVNGTASQKVSLSHPGRVSARPVRRRPSKGTTPLVPPTPDPGVSHLTTAQAAGLAGVPASTIRTWRSRGKGGKKLEPVVSDPDVLYDRQTVLDFIGVKP